MDPQVILPGKGEFKDVAGNVYSITPSGHFKINDMEPYTGYGSHAAVLYNGLIFVQDDLSLLWYNWNGTTFSLAPSPPPFPPLEVPPASPQVLISA